METKTLRELIFWSYANLAMAHSAVEKKQDKYSRLSFIIRSRLYKGLLNDKMKIRSLFHDEKIKMISSNYCCYCGKTTDITIDHIIPRASGGSDSGDNLIYACQKCNSSKGKKDMMEWMVKKETFPPLLILRRYLKIIYIYCDENNILEKTLEDLKEIKLPFKYEFIPVKFPAPAELKLLSNS